MAVACGNCHTLSLDDNGDVWAYGENIRGQCGVDTSGNDVKEPIKLDSLHNIVQISADARFSACVDVHGHLWTFGDNTYGQLGHGDNDNRNIPTRVEGLENIVSVSCGGDHIMCLTSDNVVYGCGSNEYSQLGVNMQTNTIATTFMKIPVPVEITLVVCGEYSTVFLDIDGCIWVCGRNHKGQLGLGDTSTRIDIITKNSFLKDIVHVACGDAHTIFMDSENIFYSVGDNIYGQLCLSDRDNRNVPEKIEFPEARSVSCGAFHTLLLDSSKNISIFGFRDDFVIEGEELEEFGNGILLKEPKDVCLMSYGGEHILLKCTSNEMWGFGFNFFGELPLYIPYLEDGFRTITAPTFVQSKYYHTVGSPIGNSFTRVKSARK